MQVSRGRAQQHEPQEVHARKSAMNAGWSPTPTSSLCFLHFLSCCMRLPRPIKKSRFKFRQQSILHSGHSVSHLILLQADRTTRRIQSPISASHAYRAADRISPKRVQADLEHIRQDLQRRLSSQIAHSIVSIELGSDGLVISLREAGFFNSGSAIPRPETDGNPAPDCGVSHRHSL